MKNLKLLLLSILLMTCFSIQSQAQSEAKSQVFQLEIEEAINYVKDGKTRAELVQYFVSKNADLTWLEPTKANYKKMIQLVENDAQLNGKLDEKLRIFFTEMKRKVKSGSEKK